MSIDVHTFGCRLNIAESEVIKREAEAGGVTDAVVFNTCAVTAEAVKQARQSIRRVRRERPDAKIIVTGCAAQADSAPFAAMPEVDRVLGNDEKMSAAAWRGEARVAVGDIMASTRIKAHGVDAIDGHTRAFVQVQNGCDHRCTFCIIPFGRGNSRSLAVGDVVAQARRLVANGYREIVLTGVDITSYRDGDLKLGALVKRLLRAVPEIARLRLSSIDSVEADADLLDALANEPRLMPHLHLSLQAGDDMILKRMKRRHSRSDAVAFCGEVRRLRPDVVFGADIIAGFPTETEAMFENSLKIVEECGLTHLHVFPFSPRKGTPAARMPQVDGRAIKERAARLRAAGEAAYRRHLERLVGTRQSILVERDGLGRTEGFTLAAIEGGAPGSILAATITGQDGARLIAAPTAMAAA